MPELARRSGISRATTYRLVEGSVDPRLSDLRELYLAMGPQLEVTASPVYDLAAAVAARSILDVSFSEASPASDAWVARLDRIAKGSPVDTVREAGAAASVLNAPQSVGLRADHWTIDRLVSAGHASGSRWAFSGWAALDAMGHNVEAKTVLWVDDVRVATHLLADTMTKTPLGRADVIVVRGGDAVFSATTDIEGAILVNTLQALIDCVGLGGAARSLALEIAGASR